MDDDELLRLYVEKRSDDAFRQLVQRHGPLIYGAALRRVRDPHLADDIMQAVLIAMLLKARPLSRRPSLVNWLLKATRYAAIDAMRAEAARKTRQQIAARTRLEAGPAEATDPQLAALSDSLDEAMLALNASQRAMLAMRFFQGLSHAEIGERLRVSANAVHKRIDRAMVQLRRRLEQQGLALSAPALLAGVTAIAAQTQANAAAAPLALAGDKVLASMARHTTSVARALAEAVLRHMWRLHAALVAGSGAAVAAVGLLCMALVQLSGQSKTGPPAITPAKSTVVSASTGLSLHPTLESAPPPVAQNGVYYISIRYVDIPQVTLAEPGTPVSFDFRKSPDGRPGVLQPPLDARTLTFTAEISGRARDVMLRLASGELVAIPFQGINRGAINYTTNFKPVAEYNNQGKSPVLIKPTPSRPMPDALREELSDGILDARAWLDTGEADAPSLRIQAMLDARVLLPSATEPATARPAVP